MSANRVRRLRADEWRELREIRLAALLDAPEAFATRYAEAAARDDARWRSDAARGAGTESATFVAVDDGRLVGMAGGWSGDGTARLVQMFVRPEARGTGLAGELVAAVAAWARELGFGRLELGVVEGNDAAERAYARCGFVRVGEPAASAAHGPGAREVRMVLTL
jgi:RimJ/RimL family protein N-acetyltransferase